jgi:hypothetical protein
MMMRLIDADNLKPDAQWDGFYNCYSAFSISQIDDAPTVGGWISVEDRLPEAKRPDVYGKIAFSEYVLTYTVYKDGTPWMAVDTCRVDKAEWMQVIPGDGFTVTHWMPLPEAPKEVQ